MVNLAFIELLNDLGLEVLLQRILSTGRNEIDYLGGVNLFIKLTLGDKDAKEISVEFIERCEGIEKVATNRREVGFKLLDILIDLIRNALEVKLVRHIDIGVAIKATIAGTFFSTIRKNNLNILYVAINIFEDCGDKFFDGCLIGRKGQNADKRGS